MITPYQEDEAINLANRLLKEVWTPNSNDKLQKLSVHAIFLLLGEYLLSPNPDSYNPENFQVWLARILDDTLNCMSNWELERNLSLVNNFNFSFNMEINNYKNKLDKELKSKEEKEFKKFLQDIPHLDSLTQRIIQKIPLIFLYRAQNHFIDSLNYAERAIFKSYEIAKILNISFNLDSALQKLGFGSLKDFYVAVSLLFTGLFQAHGIFDLSICSINLEDDADGIKAQKIKNLLSKVLGLISFDLTSLKNNYRDMKEMKPKKNSYQLHILIRL